MNPQFEIGINEKAAGMSEYTQEDFENTKAEMLKKTIMIYFDKVIESLTEAKDDVKNF